MLTEQSELLLAGVTLRLKSVPVVTVFAEAVPVTEERHCESSANEMLDSAKASKTAIRIIFAFILKTPHIFLFSKEAASFLRASF